MKEMKESQMTPQILFLMFLSILLLFCASVLSGTLEDWLIHQGVEFVENIRIDHDMGPPFGRGIRAARDLEKDDLLMSIPVEAMFAEVNMKPEEPFLSPAVSSFNAVGFMLLYERRRRILHLDGHELWGAYMDSLPTPGEMHLTIFWTHQQLERLQRSPLLYFTEHRKKFIESQYVQFVLTSVLNGTYAHIPLRTNKDIPIQSIRDEGADNVEYERRADQVELFYSLDLFKWALACLWSRSFSLRIDGETTSGLVPLGDLFNAAPSVSQSHVSISMDDDALRYYASRSIKKDEHILAYYGTEGTKPNDQLAMDYGFVFSSNPFDTALIPVHFLIHRKTNLRSTKCRLLFNYLQQKCPEDQHDGLDDDDEWEEESEFPFNEKKFRHMAPQAVLYNMFPPIQILHSRRMHSARVVIAMARISVASDAELQSGACRKALERVAAALGGDLQTANKGRRSRKDMNADKRYIKEIFDYGISLENDIHALTSLNHAITKELLAYGTDMNDDQDLLNSLQREMINEKQNSDTVDTYRHIIALSVRVGEKNVLKAWQNLLKKQLNVLKKVKERRNKDEL